MLPTSRRRVLFAAVPSALSQEEESALGRGYPGVSAQDRVREPGRVIGRPPDTVLHGPGLCISTLHVSLIIRVLPRAESATGCIFRQPRFERWRIRFQGRYFRSIRRALRGNDWLAECSEKEQEGGETPHLSFFFGLFYSALVAIPGNSLNWRKPRRTALRPRELRWSGGARCTVQRRLPLACRARRRSRI